MWKVGLFLFNDVEVLDFAGPFEVFSVTALDDGSQPFKVKTISEDGNSITAKNGLTVVPDYSFETAPSFDILIIPGGSGARKNEIRKPHVISWIRQQAEMVLQLASVCTGSLLLAEAGLLNGLQATSHWASVDQMEQDYPLVDVVRGTKFVDEGRIITSAGISAGIDMSFRLIERLLGRKQAFDTAKRMEYDLVLPSC